MLQAEPACKAMTKQYAPVTLGPQPAASAVDNLYTGWRRGHARHQPTTRRWTSTFISSMLDLLCAILVALGQMNVGSHCHAGICTTEKNSSHAR